MPPSATLWHGKTGQPHRIATPGTWRSPEKLVYAVQQRLHSAPELSENALRNLAVVSEAAQRIARLALGASTENVHSDPYAQITDAELATELERLGVDPAVQ